MATDASNALLRCLGRVLDRLHRVDGILWQPVWTPEEALVVAQSLLELYEGVDAALQWVLPEATVEDILGVPLAIRGSRDVAHADHPGWDFGPWVAEKLTQLKHATRRLVQTYLSHLRGPDSADEPSEGAHDRHLLQREWTVAEHYARVVYDQIYGGDLHLHS